MKTGKVMRACEAHAHRGAGGGGDALDAHLVEMQRERMRRLASLHSAPPVVQRLLAPPPPPPPPLDPLDEFMAFALKNGPDTLARERAEGIFRRDVRPVRHGERGAPRQEEVGMGTKNLMPRTNVHYAIHRPH